MTFTPKRWAVLGIAILLAIFILQNTQLVQVRFLFWKIEMSRAILLFLLLGIGTVLVACGLAMTTFALVVAVPECAIAQGLSDLAGVVGGSKAELEPSRTIAPTSSTKDDQALTKRLEEIFAQVDGLGGVAHA